MNSAISSHFAAKILGVGQQAFRDMEEFSSWLLTKNKKGQTCLLCACAGGRVDDVQLLLPHLTAMSIHVDSSNRTCAMVAASRGFEELLLARAESLGNAAAGGDPTAATDHEELETETN